MANKENWFTARLKDALGGDTIIVGTAESGNPYPNISEALNNLLADPPAKTQFGTEYGGTATTTQYSDTVTFASMDNLFNNLNATEAVTFPCWIEFDNNGDLYLVDKLISTTSLRLAAGFSTASLSGVEYKLWRIPKVTLWLAPGKHILNQTYDFSSSELCLSLVGQGKTVTTLQENDLGNSASIKFPAFGGFELANISANGASLAITFDGAVAAAKNGFGIYLSLNNVFLSKNDVIAGTDVFNASAARAFINDVEIAGKGDTFIVYADTLIANNIHIISESMSQNGFSFRCHDFQCTKSWFISTCTSFANTTNTGGIWLIRDGTDTAVTKTAFIQNCYVEDMIHAINDVGAVSTFTVYAKNNTLQSFESNRSTVEETGNSKPDGAALDAATTSNGGVVN